MKTPFACPSCAGAGAVDAALVGRQVWCTHCGHHFTLAIAGAPEAEVYAMNEPTGGPPRESVFVTSRGDEPTAAAPPRRSERPAPRATARRREAAFPWRPWIVRGGSVAVLVLAAIALTAPRGAWVVGSLLLILGSAMVMVGYGAGAYGAFSEDFLHGCLYLAVPLYTGYYLVSRWGDLWPWFACSTAGVALVLLGTGLLQWARAAV